MQIQGDFEEKVLIVDSKYYYKSNCTVLPHNLTTSTASPSSQG